MRKPAIDTGACTLCGGCLVVSPEVFSENDLGFIEVAELDAYPEAEVDEAIALCPEDAIYWEDD